MLILPKNQLLRIDEAKLKRVSEGTTLPIMYILTGSNTHEIRERASETLAGRTALIEVSSFSQCEKIKKDRDRDQKEVDLIFDIDQKLYPIEIKKGIGKDNADKSFKILEQYKMPIATGLVIDTSDRVFPLNNDTYYCPVGMIGL